MLSFDVALCYVCIVLLHVLLCGVCLSLVCVVVMCLVCVAYAFMILV